MLFSLLTGFQHADRCCREQRCAGSSSHHTSVRTPAGGIFGKQLIQSLSRRQQIVCVAHQQARFRRQCLPDSLCFFNSGTAFLGDCPQCINSFHQFSCRFRFGNQDIPAFIAGTFPAVESDQID